MPVANFVQEIMSCQVVTVYEEQNLSQVKAALSAHTFRHLPVVDGTKLVGLISERDVLRATVAGVDGGAAARSRESHYLEETFVRDVMQTKVVSIRPADSIVLAAQRMLEHRIGALPVVDERDELVGIITQNDLVRQLLEHLGQR
jgi:acetoin utilization protein AcuB